MKQFPKKILSCILLFMFISCEKKTNLSVELYGKVIDITNGSPVKNIYLSLAWSAGYYSYESVASATTDDSGYFDLKYTLIDENQALSLAVNYDYDPHSQTPVLPEYVGCFPCQITSSSSYLHAGDKIEITYNITRYTRLTVNATTSQPLQGDDYISAEIPGAGTCCIDSFPFISEKVPAEEEQQVSWTVKRNGTINQYSQNILCQADTMNYFEIVY